MLSCQMDAMELNVHEPAYGGDQSKVDGEKCHLLASGSIGWGWSLLELIGLLSLTLSPLKEGHGE